LPVRENVKIRFNFIGFWDETEKISRGSKNEQAANPADYCLLGHYYVFTVSRKSGRQFILEDGFAMACGSSLVLLPRFWNCNWRTLLIWCARNKRAEGCVFENNWSFYVALLWLVCCRIYHQVCMWHLEKPL
jgi:hypothetical protein